MKYSPEAQPPRVLMMGESTAGKTGSIAQLANAGYRILLHDFDSNSRVIGNFLDKGAADNIYIKTYDVARLTNTGILDAGQAVTKAAVAQMNDFYKMLQHWKTETEDLGPSKDLTANDVIVIDSATFLGELLLLASPAHPEANKHTPTQYRIAGAWYRNVLNQLTSTLTGASVLVLAHIMQTGDKDDQGRIIGKARDIPIGIGEKMSKTMTNYFTDVWQLEVQRDGSRRINTAATDRIPLRTSRPNTISKQEPFDLASLFSRLRT
jgi:hypothetical protein